MASKEPIEGRCAAKVKRGEGYCTNSPRSGAKRCRLHGSGSKDKPGGRPIVTGAYSKRFAREAKATQELIDGYLQDPQLLDARRPVALQAVLVQEMGLVPDEEVVREMALAKVSARVKDKYLEETGDSYEPSNAELELARRRYMQMSMNAVDGLQKAQSSAARQVQLGQMIAAEALPLFGQLGHRLRVLIDKYVPVEKQEPFIQAYRREVRSIMLRFSEIGED